jgi:hypothetical protein
MESRETTISDFDRQSGRPLPKVFHFSIPIRRPNSISSGDSGRIGFGAGFGGGVALFGLARAVRKDSRHASGGTAQHHATRSRRPAFTFAWHLQCVDDLQVSVCLISNDRRAYGIWNADLQARQLL